MSETAERDVEEPEQTALLVEDGSTTESVPNGSSSAVNIQLDAADSPDPVLLYNLDWKYLRPPPVAHPLEENVLEAFGRGCVRYLLGFLFGLPVLLLVLLLLLLVVPVRVLAYLLTRLSFRGLSAHILRRRHCDPWWPMDVSSATESSGGPVSVVQCVATVHGSLSTAEVQQIMWKKLIKVQDNSGYLRHPKLTQILSSDCCRGLSRHWLVDEHFEMENQVKLQTEREEGKGRGILSLRDLETELNEMGPLALDRKRPLWTVELVPDFGESRCTLLLFRFHTLLTDSLCIPKMFCLLNDGSLSFETEPKLRGSLVPPYNFFVSISYTLWTWCQMVTAGPLSLALAASRGPDVVWTDSLRRRGGGAQKRSTGRRRASGQALLGGGLRRRVTWARVPNVEQVIRAERILRATTLELLLAFIAGALRRHFRSQGIRHPPDVQMSVPVSTREFLPVTRHHPCRFFLLPLSLPVSVEGCIPRVWEVQRIISDTLEGAFPQACRAATAVGDLLLPSGWVRGLLRRVHSGSGCTVAFLRCNGDLTLNSRKVHSMLLYQPVSEFVHAGFTFIQSGHEMVVSLTVDQRIFPDPDALLTHFQAELQALIRQLAIRMLTLSQATFLPSPLMNRLSQLNKVPVREDADTAGPRVRVAIQIETENNNSRQGEDTPLKPVMDLDKLSPDMIAIDAEAESEEEEESLEELEKLLGTVQAEIEAMKTQPRGSRHDCIAKLSELEAKMEKFHSSIAARLNLDGRRGSGSLDSGVVEALLQPYREEAEEARRDSGFKLRRKRSKRLDSPTRISPKQGRNWDSDAP